LTAFSVVMPTYNRAHFITEALDSAFRQTVPPLEVVVVDDRSSDDTSRIVAAHPQAARIRYHIQEQNQGASVARNVGAEMAKGEFIVFLDSDDVLEPMHHERVAAALTKDPDVTLFCNDSWMIDEKGTVLHDGRSWTEVQCAIKGVKMSTGRRSLEDIFLFSTPFPGYTIRRGTYLAAGGLRQETFPLDDYELQLRIAGSGAVVHYEHAPLARYRVHGANESGAARAARVGRKKLEVVEEAIQRYPQLAALGGRKRRRRGEVRRELALSLLRDGRRIEGGAGLLWSLAEDPGGLADLVRIGKRKLTGAA
jgi:glycosyltransferase involved in cell wall biosynthesis